MGNGLVFCLSLLGQYSLPELTCGDELDPHAISLHNTCVDAQIPVTKVEIELRNCFMFNISQRIYESTANYLTYELLYPFLSIEPYLIFKRFIIVGLQPSQSRPVWYSKDSL